MPIVHQFEPEAQAEYQAAIRYYAMEAEQAGVAARFVAAVESALAAICAAPEMWRVVEPPWSISPLRVPMKDSVQALS